MDRGDAPDPGRNAHSSEGHITMAIRLAIGEFSVMTHLSRKALRHYHELGLLQPAEIDPVTGYRYYDTMQLRSAQVIRRFRQLDMPVPEIRAILAAPNVEVRSTLIAAHLRRMEFQLEETRQAVTALRELLEPDPRPVEITFRSVPETQAAGIFATVTTGELGEWWQSAMDEIVAALRDQRQEPAGPTGGLYATGLFSEEIGAATVYVPTSHSIQATGRVASMMIPAAELAIAVHHGPERTIDQTYAALGTAIAEQLIGIEGPVRERYLVRPALADDPGRQTEIGWPIFRTSLD